MYNDFLPDDFQTTTSVKLSFFLGDATTMVLAYGFFQRFGATSTIAGEWPLGELWCGYSAGVRFVEMGRQKETIYIICIYIYMLIYIYIDR